MLNGAVVKINSEKGFGFIKPEKGDDVFFHHKAYSGNFDQLNEGQTVQYQLDDQAEKARAKKVELTGEIVKAAPARKFDKRNSRDADNRGGRNQGFDRNRDQNRRGSFQSNDRRDSRDRNRAGVGGGDRTSFSDRTQDGRKSFERPVPENCEFGHVVRIYRHDGEGRISATTGGKEILFAQRALSGQTFGSLEIGQYVQFAMKRETIGTDEPEAYFVQAAKRYSAPTIGMLARHPKARAKKPTWRNKS